MQHYLHFVLCWTIWDSLQVLSLPHLVEHQVKNNNERGGNIMCERTLPGFLLNLLGVSIFRDCWLAMFVSFFLKITLFKTNLLSFNRCFRTYFEAIIIDLPFDFDHDVLCDLNSFLIHSSKLLNWVAGSF